MCLLLKVKRPVPTRSMKKVCTKNLFLQIDRGNLINCLKTSVLNVITMEQGNPLSKTARAHTVKEQFAPEENRDIASCELLDVEPKAQCKVCLSYWDVGIVNCTCGHFLRDDTKENKKYLKFTLDLFSIPNYYIKKGRPTVTATGRRGSRALHREFAQEKCNRRDFLGIHDRFFRDERFRKTMIELGRTVELISKKHCLPCDASRMQRIRLITKIGGKALPHLGGTGKILGGILHLSITATMDPALIDRGNLLHSAWANYSWNDSQH